MSSTSISSLNILYILATEAASQFFLLLWELQTEQQLKILPSDKLPLVSCRKTSEERINSSLPGVNVNSERWLLFMCV